MSCARRAKGSVKLRSPMVLCTHGSGRARGEREERAGAQSLQCVVSSISCAGRARRLVRLRSPMDLSTHGSGRARGEREERAGAQTLQCVVSSISCAGRARRHVRLRSPIDLSTQGSGRARGEREKQGTWGRLAAGRHAAYAKMPLLPRNGVRAGEGVGSERAG